MPAGDGRGRYSHPGFLAAYPETQFVQLESFATYPTIWAPYYTCHKIMRGLLDAYLLVGNTQALDVVTRMGDWVHSRLSRLSRDDAQPDVGHLHRRRERRDERGHGRPVRVDRQAELPGGRDVLRQPAGAVRRLPEQPDTLTRLHANTHVPQFLGYLRVFDQNGVAEYRTVAENF